MTSESRYEGKPLLLIIENYILDVLGELDAEKRQMTEKVVMGSFPGESDWHVALRHTLGLNDEFDPSLKELWARNQDIAKAENVSLTALDFARMIVDDNFAEFIV